MNNQEKKNIIEFGLRLKELRLEKNISQEKLAELADLHRTYIGMIERGERNLTLKNMFRIANALKINIRDLFNEK